MAKKHLCSLTEAGGLQGDPNSATQRRRDRETGSAGLLKPRFHPGGGRPALYVLKVQELLLNDLSLPQPTFKRAYPMKAPLLAIKASMGHWRETGTADMICRKREGDTCAQSPTRVEVVQLVIGEGVVIQSPRGPRASRSSHCASAGPEEGRLGTGPQHLRPAAWKRLPEEQPALQGQVTVEGQHQMRPPEANREPRGRGRITTSLPCQGAVGTQCANMC